MWQKDKRYNPNDFAFTYQYDKDTEFPYVSFFCLEDLHRSLPAVSVRFVDIGMGKRCQRLPIEGYANSSQDSNGFSLHLQSWPHLLKLNLQYLIAYMHGLQPFNLAEFPELKIFDIEIPYLSKFIQQDSKKAYLSLQIIVKLAAKNFTIDDAIKQEIIRLLTTNNYYLKNVYRTLDLSQLLSCLPNDPQKYLTVYLLMQSLGQELEVAFAQDAEPNVFLQLGLAYEALGDDSKACEYYHLIPKNSPCYKEALVKLKEYYGSILCAHEANLIQLSDEQVQAYKYYYAKYTFLTSNPEEQSVLNQMSQERRGEKGMLPSQKNIRLNFHNFFNMEAEIKRLTLLNAELTDQNNRLTNELASYKSPSP